MHSYVFWYLAIADLSKLLAGGQFLTFPWVVFVIKNEDLEIAPVQKAFVRSSNTLFARLMLG
jgi:hypothetical protein